MSAFDAVLSPSIFSRVDRPTVRIWIVITLVELYLLLGYFALTPGKPTGEFRYLLYPFVWINVGLWAIWRTEPRTRSTVHRFVGVAAAVAYFLAVMAVPGNVAIGASSTFSVRVAWLSPGWGPLVAVTGPIRLYLLPFEVVGYAALSYLVYANILSMTRGILSGALGVVTCVGCTVPVIVPLVGLVGGSATGLVTTAYKWSYDVGTLIFVLAVTVLYWSHCRPHASK